MFYVYILKSEEDNHLYIGYSKDLRRRLAEHNAKTVRSTKGRGKFTLKYYEAYEKEEDARHREFSLKKNGKALSQLKRRISASLQ